MVNLPIHAVTLLLKLVQARIEVVKKRILKDNQSDWSDYNDEQIIWKLKEANKEFNTLWNLEDDLQNEINFLNKKR